MYMYRGIKQCVPNNGKQCSIFLSFPGVMLGENISMYYVPYSEMTWKISFATKVAMVNFEFEYDGFNILNEIACVSLC